MRKRILILSFYYEPDLCAGSFRATALIESLQPIAKTLNIQIDVITTQPNRYANFQIDAPAIETQGCVTIYRIAIPTHQSGFIDQAKAFSYYFFQTIKLTRKDKYDLIYATSSRLFTAFLGARIASREKKPLFLDMRDIFTDTMDSLLKFPLNLLLPFFSFIERYTIKRAAALNVVSNGFLTYFKVQKCCDVFTYSHGIDHCFYGVDYNHLDVNRVKKRVLYAGNFGQGQGIEKIIPALAEAFKNQCEFIMIGSGGQLNALQNACTGLDNVRILSPINRLALIQYYKEADVLFLHLNDCPAFNKVLPSKIFEYAMTGKPILAGVSGCAADFLSQNVPGSWCFTPCHTEQGIAQLHRILKSELKNEDREVFYKKFNREGLMHELATKVVSYVY